MTEVTQYLNLNREAVRALSQPKLDALGLLWEDVEDVIPITFPAMKVFLRDVPTPQRSVLSSSMYDMAKVEEAVITTLSSWKILRSIAIDSREGPPLLLLLRCNERYLKKAISHLPEVNDKRALSNVPLGGDHWKGEVPRGLLCKFALTRVADTGHSGLICNINHTVVDGIAIRRFVADLVTAMTKGILCEKVDWSLFSEIYRFYDNSLPAQEVMAFHLRRLRGIKVYRNSLWPVSGQIMTKPKTPSNSQSREAIEDHTYSIQHAQVRHPPNLPNRHGEHAVRLAIITKAAIALFNCCRTGTSAALIAVALSGRVWPFLDQSVACFLPNPQHIAGPTISMSLDIVRLGPKETVAQLLKRLDQEQQLITQNTHCPLRILDHLDVEDRSMWVLARKQIFNWCPFAPTQLRNADGTTALEVLVDEGSKVDEPVNEFIWRCGITDDKQLRIEVYASRELFEKSELENFCRTNIFFH